MEAPSSVAEYRYKGRACDGYFLPQSVSVVSKDVRRWVGFLMRSGDRPDGYVLGACPSFPSFSAKVYILVNHDM